MPVRVNGIIETTDELLEQAAHLAGIVESFFTQPLPDACEALIYRCDLANQNHAYLSGFERYCARLLRSVGAERLRKVFSRHDLSVGRLGSTGLAWIGFDVDLLKPDEQKVVLGVESAINRIILMVKAATSAEDLVALSLGTGEPHCMETDWNLLRLFGNEIDAFSAHMQAENPLQGLNGTKAPKGGEWDTRTRFARSMECLIAPYRLSYRFDCQVDRGIFEVHVNTLSPSLLPPQRVDGVLKEWTDASAEGNRLAMSYTLRLCGLVAGAAFFSNVAITDVVVTAHRDTLAGDAIASVYFQRMPYLMNVVPAMKMGDLSKPETIADPLATARIMDPASCHFAFDETGRARAIEALRIDFDERRIPTWQDHRPIPDYLRTLLHADEVADLDVSHIEDDDLAASVREAALDHKEFPMASMATFEEVLDAHAEDLCGNALFCIDESARVLMGLADPSDNRYDKYPDALYVAKQKLSSINQDLGDLEAALVFAQECVELAPTSPSAHLDLAGVYLDMNRPADAIHALQMGLCFAIDPSTIQYCYYRLAYAYFLHGEMDVAIALYTYCMSVKGGRFVHQATNERNQVLVKTGRVEAMSVADALKVMEDNVPMAPTREVLNALSQALIGLVELGAFTFAWPLCLQLANRQDRDVLQSVAESIRVGVEHC